MPQASYPTWTTWDRATGLARKKQTWTTFAAEVLVHLRRPLSGLHPPGAGDPSFGVMEVRWGKSSNGGTFQLLGFIIKECVESNANAKIKVTDPVVDGMPMPGLRGTGFIGVSGT